jgi:RNA polymerase sigma-70 factor (ECF subfamily)
VTEEFEAHRDHLFGVAYRMLGSRAEAEDAVQETYLRLAAVDRSSIGDLRAWLTTVTGRICLDVLRSARVRREAYVGPWLPEPLVARLPAEGVGPDAAVVRDEEVSLALLVVLETLTPEQRVAFVLHDVFAVPFDEIATVLATSAPATRQLATRARRAVAEGRPRHTATRAEQRAVVHAFLDAVRGGDINRLLALLAPDVIAVGDGGGVLPAGRHPVVGALKVARFMAGLFRQVAQIRATGVVPPAFWPAGPDGPGGPAGPVTVIAEEILVNGDVGLLIEFGEPPVRLVMGFAVEGDRITGIFDQVNPAKLTAVPRVDPARNLFAQP